MTLDSVFIINITHIALALFILKGCLISNARLFRIIFRKRNFA